MSREKKFTPGPWSVDGRITNGVEGFEIHWSADGECVTDHVYTLPDANLIAAAPELLEALEEALKWHKGDKWRDSNGSERERWRQHNELLESAIKKAYGETE